jgi:hypothetical protein
VAIGLGLWLVLLEEETEAVVLASSDVNDKRGQWSAMVVLRRVESEWSRGVAGVHVEEGKCERKSSGVPARDKLATHVGAAVTGAGGP